MKILKPTTFDIVVQSWLQAEWYLPHFDNVRPAVPITLIESRDTRNLEDNLQRLNLLRSIRSPIIDPLPNLIQWYIASFDREDIGRTYIVPSNDWATVSNNTYHPIKVMENLHLDDGHAKKINEIK